MLNVMKYPDPVLRQIAEPVEEIDDEIRRLIEDMAEVMYQDDGIGLAAPQVGLSIRLLVVDIGEGLKGLINPEIISHSEEQEPMEEGCLSLPGIQVNVTRPVKIKVAAFDESGQSIEVETEGLYARVIQHEMDHLDGRLIIDHASTVQRSLLKSKLKRLEKMT